MKFLVHLCAVTSIVCFVLSEDIKQNSTFNYEEKILEMVLKGNKEIMNVQDVKQLIQLLINNTEENESELKDLLAEHDSNFVGGGWSDWESWSCCSVAIGEGFQTRVRRCDNPTPSSHGRYCHGDTKEWRMCDGTQTNVTDCLDIYRKCPSSPDGVYRVNLWNSKTAISVYCDMTSSNGGWTVFQNRYDGSEEFYLDLNAYTEGFGNTSAEFWLGLRYIKELADQGNTTLRMEVGAADGSEAYEEWPEFQLGAEPGYKLHVGGNGTGTAGDKELYFLKSQNGMDFTAKGSSCGNNYRGGWWFKTCTYINLNGHYAPPGTESEYHSGLGGTMYRSFKGNESLKSSRIMLRRVG